MKNLFLISDLHIWWDNLLDYCDFEDDLIKFLKSLESYSTDTELILVWDIFSMWEISWVEWFWKLQVIIESHQLLFNQFKNTGSKITISLIVWNHDMELLTDIKFKVLLKDYNINLIKTQYAKRQIWWKKIRIEHWNQLDMNNAYEKWGSVEKLPIWYYFNRNLINKIEGIFTNEHSKWLKWFINVHPHSNVPIWLFSNYFYRQMNPFLRYSILPFILLLTFSFITLILSLLQKYNIINWSFFIKWFSSTFWIVWNIIDFIIFIDIVFIVSFLTIWVPIYLLIFDFIKVVKSYNLPISKVESKKLQISKIRELIKNQSSYDIFIFGHTHEPNLHYDKIDWKKKIIINTWTWLKSFRRIKTWFRYIPPVFVATQDLNYFRIYENNWKVTIQYKQNHKPLKNKFTILERLVTLWSKYNLKPRFKSRINL